VVTDNLTAPEWCLGCPDPIYDNRRGEWDYLVMVEDDKVDQVRAALEMVGTFVPEEGV
jgi:hypothetical protein